MRILPLAFWLHAKYGPEIDVSPAAMQVIHDISALTHAHPRSMMACEIYTIIACRMIEGDSGYTTTDGRNTITEGLRRSRVFYEIKNDFRQEISPYSRIFASNFPEIPEHEIRSCGYVVDTLEAAIWCLCRTDSYAECVLTAVNLGDDTDTTAAVAGGLAGLRIRDENDAIPPEWLEMLARCDDISAMCDRFGKSLADPK